MTSEIRQLVAEAHADFLKHRPEVIDGPALDVQIQMASEIHEHLARGGELKERGLLYGQAIRKRWQSAYGAWRVDSRPPETAEEVASVWRFLDIKFKRAELGRLWDALMAATHAQPFADLHGEPERAVGQFAHAISQCLDWWKVHWSGLVEQLRLMGFNWTEFLSMQPLNVGAHGEMLRCVNAVESRLLDELATMAKHLGMLESERKLDESLKNLTAFDCPEVEELRRVIQLRDPDRYQIAARKCLDAIDRQEAALIRHELLTRLERKTASGAPLAEEWALAIRNRAGIHGGPESPGDPTAAWEWRQFNDELERRGKLDLGELGDRIANTQDSLRRTTRELIDRRAWAAQVRRTSRKQREALMGWLDTIKRIGKGTGKRAPQLRREAQRLMEDCRTAVPVWIMPLVRLAESFDFGKQCFDVVIIDEASQCDVMALLALPLAKNVVIVGDDEQVSPLAVGQNQDAVNHLIDLHLQGFRLRHLYDGFMSIYDFGKQSFEGLISLKEHFRCVPPIIQFSNYLCYQGNIKPLREESSSFLRPHLVPFRVEGVCDREVNVNSEEVWTVASLLAAALERPEYRGMTFGVISLLGDMQAYEIEQLLLKHIRPDEYQRRRIICGNSAQFQGDERHVMFLSMVWSPEESPLRFLDRKEFRQRFNVAASRARDQTWLVYSVDPSTDLKSGDLRRRLIEHFLDPGAVTRELDRSLERTQSPFERLVLGYLVRAGYRVTPQWPVSRYRIDFVVEGGGQRLALECDGDRYHPIEKLPDDMERQATLERSGWRFMRIRGSAFFRDQERTMQSVFKRLEDLGIVPEMSQQPNASEENVLVSQIKRRASELRASWRQGSRTENFSASDSQPEAALEMVARRFADKKRQREESPQVVVDSHPVNQPSLFSSEENAHLTAGRNSARATPPTKDSHESVTHEAPSQAEQAQNVKKCADILDIDVLVSTLDKALFPAVAGTEPRGSRKDRLDRWHNALNSCERTLDAMYAAVTESDPAIIKGKYKQKVLNAIRSWLAGSQH